MKRGARVDANQAQIVEALRAAGATVLHLHMLGSGAPDLAVGIGGRNYFLEVKDGRRKPSERRLTPAEQRWHEDWRGQVAVVGSVGEALAAIGR